MCVCVCVCVWRGLTVENVRRIIGKLARDGYPAGHAKSTGSSLTPLLCPVIRPVRSSFFRHFTRASTARSFLLRPFHLDLVSTDHAATVKWVSGSKTDGVAPYFQRQLFLWFRSIIVLLFQSVVSYQIVSIFRSIKFSSLIRSFHSVRIPIVSHSYFYSGNFVPFRILFSSSFQWLQ